MMNLSSDLEMFLGRFHVVLVHLPIGFILLLAALEVLGCWRVFQRANASAGYVLLLAVPASVAAAVCGWLLEGTGGYDEPLLLRHQWTGIATATGCALTALVYAAGWKTLYRISLFATVVVLTVASHLGGSLTHGKDYLTQHAPPPIRAWLGGSPPAPPTAAKPASLADLNVFPDVVQPMLAKYCVSCHGEEKARGGLRCDTLAGLIEGGDSGSAVVPGNSGAGLLLGRMRLPLDDDEHMPPAGKPQPSADDLALLEWWIDGGAPEDKRLGAMSPPPAIDAILETRFAPRDTAPEPAGKSRSMPGAETPAL